MKYKNKIIKTINIITNINIRKIRNIKIKKINNLRI